MKIKLTCRTGGYAYGDVVDTEKSKTIDDKLAENLIADGHAVAVDAAPVAEPEAAPEPEVQDDLQPVGDMEWGALKSEAAKAHGIDIKGMKRPDLEAAVEAARNAE
jgi:hypothetical protein